MEYLWNFIKRQFSRSGKQH